MEWIVSASAFLFVVCVCLAVQAIGGDIRKHRQRRAVLAILAETSADRPAGRTTGADPGKDGVLVGLAGKLLDLRSTRNSLSAVFPRASLDQFILLSICSGTLCLLVPLGLYPHPLLLVGVFCMGSLIPSGFLAMKKSQQESELVQQLPEAIDMVVRSLKVGQSVDAAIQEAARSLRPPVATEFRRVYDEIAVGLPFDHAIRNMGRRYEKLTDMRLLCTAFTIQRETGGNLTEILGGLSATIRDRYRLKSQVKAKTAEVRSSAAIIGALPPLFLVVTWMMRPAYVGLLFTHPLGKAALMFALIVELAGFAVMRMLARIDV